MSIIELGRDFNRDAFLGEYTDIWKAPPAVVFNDLDFVTRVRVFTQLLPGRDGVLRSVGGPRVDGKVLRANADAFQDDDDSVAVVSLDFAAGYLEPGVPHAVMGGIVTVGARRLGGPPVEEGIKRLLNGIDAEFTRMFTQHSDRLRDAGMLPPRDHVADVQQVLDLLEQQLKCSP